MRPWQLLATIVGGWCRRAPRFERYRPAPRHGNRRVERRLLRRFAATMESHPTRP